jgi:hypothetical protein
MTASGHSRPRPAKPKARTRPLRPNSGQTGRRFTKSALCQSRPNAPQREGALSDNLVDASDSRRPRVSGVFGSDKWRRSPRIVSARLSRLKSKTRPAERHPRVLWKPQRFVQLRIVKNVPEMIDDLAISTTARNTNARNVSLLCSNADFTAGERTRSRNRATAAASGSLCVGGRFCHSKFCAALIALSIMRSDFMEKKREALVCRFVRIV